MWLEELKKGSHRHFSTGFFLDKTSTKDQNYESASYVRNYDFIGVVRGHDEETGLPIVEQRNRMFVGDKIEIIGPGKETVHATILEMYNEEGESIESAPHAKQIVKMKLDVEVEEYYMLRKPITSINTL